MWMYFNIFEQLDGVCPVVRMLYPASDWTGDGETVTFDDSPSCDELDPYLSYLK